MFHGVRLENEVILKDVQQQGHLSLRTGTRLVIYLKHIPDPVPTHAQHCRDLRLEHHAKQMKKMALSATIRGRHMAYLECIDAVAGVWYLHYVDGDQMSTTGEMARYYTRAKDAEKILAPSFGSKKKGGRDIDNSDGEESEEEAEALAVKEKEQKELKNAGVAMVAKRAKEEAATKAKRKAEKKEKKNADQVPVATAKKEAPETAEKEVPVKLRSRGKRP